jgi:hypothetical protein
MNDHHIDPDDFARALAFIKAGNGRQDPFRLGFARRDLFHGEGDSNTIRLYQFAAGERVGLEVIGPVPEPIVHLTADESEALGRELIARASIARALEAGEDVGDAA